MTVLHGLYVIPGEEDEICDGLDNDCSGHVDDPPNKARCSIGLGSAIPLAWECKADGSDVTCNAPVIQPGTEICDEGQLQWRG